MYRDVDSRLLPAMRWGRRSRRRLLDLPRVRNVCVWRWLPVNSQRSADPLTVIENGVAWYDEGANRTTHEGRIELYSGWVRLAGSIPAWIPRERVEEVHEQ